MSHLFVRSLVVVCALGFLTAPAHASPRCTELVGMLNGGDSSLTVIARLQEKGAVDQALIQCLVDNGAPMAVVLAARALHFVEAKPAVAEPMAVAADPVPAPEESSPSPEPEPAPDLMPPPEAAASPVPRRPRPSPKPRAHRRPMPPPPVAYRSPPPPPVTYDVVNRENYTEYGINGLTDVEQDAQSTFSIDVDTASYTISRRKLTEGSLPSEAAVRPEEFINWLPYDYEPPRNNSNAPFSVHLESAPNPFMAHREVLRVGIKGKVPSGARRPVHLTFLVDTSGSMSSSDKLPLAMKALHELVDNLGMEDTIALATYAGSNRKVLGPTPITRRHEIHRAIDQLRSGGGTAMASGMLMAYEMASDMYLSGSENRVVVLSDGDANIGATSHDQILATIDKHAKRGITMTTVGFGMGNYQDTMMEQLANKGDGNYFYIDSFKEAQKVFGQDLSGTIQTIARDVKIQVEFNPDAVHAYRLIGYENRDIADKDFRNDKVDAGEIGAGHSVTALYDVVRNESYRGDALAEVHIRAKRPGPDVAAREWTTHFPSTGTSEMFTDASPDFRIAYVAAEFAQKLKGSPYAAETSWEELIGLAHDADRGKDEDADLIGNIERAAQLSGYSSSTLAGAL